MNTIPEIGIEAVPVFGLHDHEYRSMEGISQSLLKEFAAEKTPAHFKTREPFKGTKDTEFGTVLHVAVLEPERLPSAYHLQPDTYEAKTKAGTETRQWHGGAEFCKEWIKTHSDRAVLDSEAAAKISPMVESIKSQSQFSALLENGQREVSWFKRDAETGLVVKCRTDVIATDSNNITIIGDIKKTRRGFASEEDVQKTVVDFGYHIQAASYMAITGASRFIFCFVEDEPPFASNLVELDFEAIAIGLSEWRDILSRYAECVKSNSWPSYKPGIKVVGLPTWKLKKGVA